MVWIHGGAFVGGSGSTPWYDGSTFARAEVVVVTLNYRLGVLGFLHLAELSGEKYASSGNCGLLDQIAALTWVHDEIAAFGGDPNRVTVFGESAGGMSIGTLLAMPSAKGLFQQAILQSGSTSAFRSSEQAARTTSAVLTHLDVGVDQLVELPGERLVDAQIAVSGGSDTGGFLAFQPVVDGTSLFEPPAAAVAASSAAGIRILIGSNKNEMTLFLTFDPALADFDEIRLARRGAALVGEQAFTRMAAGYTRSRPDATPAALLEAVMTDQVFRMPAIRLAEAQISCDTPAWMYRFDWPTPVFGGVLGATHALELPFVWDVLDRRGVEVLTGDGPGRQELADRMHAAWLAFARTGQPTTTLLPDWPAYDTTRRATMLFDETCHVVDDPAAAERLLWEGIL
jgi:para-nitrobenzyl esterase